MSGDTIWANVRATIASCTVLLVVGATLAAAGPAQAADQWWDTNWGYRYPVTVTTPAGGTDQLVEFEVNFTTALHADGEFGAVDIATLRLVEVNAAGAVLGASVPFQFEPAPGYAATTSAAGTVVMVQPGFTSANEVRLFHLYFDVVGQSRTAANVTPTIVVTDNVIDQGLASLRIETSAATWYYQKAAGGFSSIVDTAGNDWLNHNAAAGSAGQFRGLPNAVYNGTYFHPGETSSTTTVVHSGPLRVVFESVTANGWKARWEVSAQHARMHMVQSPGTYWFLYEGTPGGQIDLGTDQVIYSDGTNLAINANRTQDMADPEWVAFTDAATARALYLVHHQADALPDRYYLLNNEMTVFGFGRGAGVNRYLTGANTFTVGFASATTYGSIAGHVDDIVAPATAAIGGAEKLGGTTAPGLSFVTTAGNTQGWVLINNTKQWVNTACRTELEVAGATFVVTPWSAIGPVPAAGPLLTCAALVELIDGNDGGPGHADASFVTTAQNTAGWALVDGTKQWVSQGCRIELEAAGATFATVAYNTFGSLPAASPAASCSALAALISGNTGNPAVSSANFVTTVQNSAGWALVGQTKQWLSASCRTQLESAGATFATVAYDTFGSLPAASPAATCNDLESLISDNTGNPGGSSGTFVTTAQNPAGWVLVGQTKQWLSASCRAQLEAAGATFTTVAYNTFGSNAPASPALSCNQMQDLI